MTKTSARLVQPDSDEKAEMTKAEEAEMTKPEACAACGSLDLAGWWVSL